MEGSLFQVDLQDRAVLDAINGAIAKLEHTADLMADIGAQLEANAQLRFDTKTDPTGAPWPALSATTREIYTSEWFIKLNPDYKAGVPGTLLERTRRLRDSLAFNSGEDWVEIGTSRATAGGRWEVGFLHEFGTKTMPRRGFLTADPETGTLGAGDEADVLDLVQQFLDAAFGG